jgi:hypothetical protein
MQDRQIETTIMHQASGVNVVKEKVSDQATVLCLRPHPEMNNLGKGIEC